MQFNVLSHPCANLLVLHFEDGALRLVRLALLVQNLGHLELLLLASGHSRRRRLVSLSVLPLLIVVTWLLNCFLPR